MCGVVVVVVVVEVVGAHGGCAGCGLMWNVESYLIKIF